MIILRPRLIHLLSVTLYDIYIVCAGGIVIPTPSYHLPRTCHLLASTARPPRGGASYYVHRHPSVTLIGYGAPSQLLLIAIDAARMPPSTSYDAAADYHRPSSSASTSLLPTLVAVPAIAMSSEPERRLIPASGHAAIVCER